MANQEIAELMVLADALIDQPDGHHEVAVRTAFTTLEDRSYQIGQQVITYITETEVHPVDDRPVEISLEALSNDWFRERAMSPPLQDYTGLSYGPVSFVNYEGTCHIPVLGSKTKKLSLALFDPFDKATVTEDDKYYDSKWHKVVSWLISSLESEPEDVQYERSWSDMLTKKFWEKPDERTLPGLNVVDVSDIYNLRIADPEPELEGADKFRRINIFNQVENNEESGHLSLSIVKGRIILVDNRWWPETGSNVLDPDQLDPNLLEKVADQIQAHIS